MLNTDKIFFFLKNARKVLTISKVLFLKKYYLNIIYITKLINML